MSDWQMNIKVEEQTEKESKQRERRKKDILEGE